MRRSLLLCIPLILLLSDRLAAQQTMLDLVPDDAAAAILLRHPNDLKAKGDKFIKEAELDVGFRLSDLFDMVLTGIGINKGIDFNRSGGAILLRPLRLHKNDLGLQDLEDNLLVAIPVADLDDMASNFGLEKGALRPGMVTEVKSQEVHWIVAKDKHIFLAAKRKPLERYLKAKTGGGPFSAEQRKAYNEADILVFAGAKALRDVWESFLVEVERQAIERQLEKLDDPLDDPQEKEAIKRLIKSLKSVDVALLGVRLGNGLGVSAMASFDPKAQEGRAFLADLVGKKRPSSLNGLPDGNVVIAESWAGSGEKNGLLARAMLHLVLRNVLEFQHFTSPTDRPSFLGVFNEVWRRLDGHRIGVYLTSDESRRGLFSVVAILEAADAPGFLRDLRILARIAEGTVDLTRKSEDNPIDIAKLVSDLGSEQYSVRASAMTKLRMVGEPALQPLKKAVESQNSSLETIRRAEKLILEISQVAAERRRELLEKAGPKFIRPTFAWAANAEKRLGQNIDVVQIKLPDADKGSRQTMKQLLGPDWDKLRLAVVDNQIVVLLGSETELFDQALANVKDRKPGLAASKRFADLTKQKPARANGEFHAALGTLTSLITGGRDVLRPNDVISSGALTVGETDLQIDVFVPVAEFRVLGRRIKE